MSRSDKRIPKLIKTCVFLSSLAIDKGVNNNPNKLVTNKPILEIEIPNWRAETILLATLNFHEFTVLEKGETSPYF